MVIKTPFSTSLSDHETPLLMDGGTGHTLCSSAVLRDGARLRVG